MAAPTITTALRQALKGYLPFSAMTAEDLDFLIEHVEIAYFEAEEVLLSPADGVPSHCYIVKQGRVVGETVDRKALAFEAGAGDCFPVGALLAERPVTLIYRSVADTFCLLLPRGRFEELARRSAPFMRFCKRRLGAMLDLSRQQLQATSAAEATAERTMNTPLRELMRAAPLACRPDTPLREALAAMQRAHVGSIVVTGGDGQDKAPIEGILTRTDLIGRVILPEVPLSSPVAEVMTRNVLTLEASDTAADAALLMAEHSIRHVPLVDDGQLVGVISERDLFALQRLTVRQLAVAIRRAASVDALALVAADIRQLSLNLVAQGVAAPQMTRLISHLNDQLTRRLLAIGCERYGVATDTFCWLSFGSEGRNEQTIATDQDNGLLITGGEELRPQLLKFADWVNEALAACGFPLCAGNIMARNPELCLTYSEWEAKYARWIDRGDPESLLAASIYFDCRPLYGATASAAQLRSEVIARAQANSRFLKQMADNALRNQPPATGRMAETLFGDTGPATVDLKMQGTVPFVDGARIWALAAGLQATNTSERLLALAAAERLPRDDVEGWVAAFEFFQLMRLREQQRRSALYESSDTKPNVVQLAALSPLDRRIVAESFRQARKAQQRLELDFPG